MKKTSGVIRGGCFVAMLAVLILNPVSLRGAGLSGPRGDLVIRDFRYTEYHAGDKRWALQAESARHDFDRETARVESLRLQMFPAAGGAGLSLRADSGVIKFAVRTVELQGTVEAQDTRGYRFLTDQLRYDDQTRMAEGQGPITVESAGLELTGRGFDYAASTGVFRIHRRVEALITLPRK